MNARLSLQRSGIPTLPMTDLMWLSVFTIPPSVAVGFLITFVVSRWTDVSVSAMEIMGGLGLWYIGILSGWSAFNHVPLFVASGKTRKYAFISWLAGLGGMSLVAALLVAIAYSLERAMYHSFGWTPGFSDSHLFTSGYQVHLVFLEYLTAFLVLGAIGGFVGASVYRSRSFGWTALIPGTILGAVAGTLERGNVRIMGFVSRETFGVDQLATVLQVILTLLVVLTALAMAFAVVREVPLRNR